MHPYAAADSFINADPKSRTSSKVESGSALPVPSRPSTTSNGKKQATMGHFQGSWRKKFQILCYEIEARVGFAQTQDLNQLATALGQGQRSSGPNLS